MPRNAAKNHTFVEVRNGAVGVERARPDGGAGGCSSSERQEGCRVLHG